jgi:hypothetical protein
LLAPRSCTQPRLDGRWGLTFGEIEEGVHRAPPRLMTIASFGLPKVVMTFSIF